MVVDIPINCCVRLLRLVPILLYLQLLTNTILPELHLVGLLYRMSQEERTKLRESVPYVKLYRYNPKHLYPKLNGYGDNGIIDLRCRGTYLLTPWSRVLLEKLTGSAASQGIPRIFET